MQVICLLDTIGKAETQKALIPLFFWLRFDMAYANYLNNGEMEPLQSEKIVGSMWQFPENSPEPLAQTGKIISIQRHT